MMDLSGASNQMERCLLRKEVVKVPLALIQDIDVFREVVSPNTWQKVLTDAQRRHLLKFLPSFPQNDVLEKQDTLRKLMGGQNIKFGNPAKQFHSKLKEGLFSPDIAKYTELCRKARKKEYNYQQQVYYSTLLQDIIVNRQRVLEAAYKTPMGEPLQLDPLEYLPPPKERSLQFRIKKHYRRVIREVHEEAGASDCSSESDDEWSMRKTQKPIFKPDSPEEKNVQPTFGPKRHAVMGSGDAFSEPRGVSDVAKGRSASPSEDVTDDDFTEILKRHRKRRMNAEETDDLDTRGISMEGIMTRCHTSRRNVRQHQNGMGVAKKKPKIKLEKKQMKIKDMDLSPPPTSIIGQPQLAQMSGESALFGGYPGQRGSVKEEDDDHMQELSDDIDVETDLEAPPRILSQPRTDFGLHACFFSLLRDLICEDADSKTSTMKLEEKVREWQDCAASSRNVWITEQSSWVDVVASALRFMSGDVIGLTLENFVPLVDYKERAQQWRWIGTGRDLDEILTPLCKHWLENKDEMSLDISDRADAATPPPRSRTNYVVRTSSEEEKDLFREQEQIRFENPHRAFTYHMHQYESVVGPVKGVYNKESSMNKAREHAILVKERPSYVTILTLVRDAAARLPNGEGTRADICELLKDSQFLSPNVTDGQINTVVSGALDRLHYEKDPCVKYDVNRKLWIYLHRNREEIDFERIHQAQGAAAKAKKALTKPKPSKKSKEASAKATAASAGTAPSTPAEVGTISMETPGNISVIPAGKQTPPVKTPQASPKSTAQVSPKIVASHTVRQTQGGKTVANLVAQQQLLKQQALQQAAQQQQVTAVKVATPTVKVTTSTFAQPHAGGKPAVSTGQLGLGAATKPVAFSILQGQPKIGKPGGETVAQQLQARALAKQQESAKAVAVSTTAGQTSVVASQRHPTPTSSPKPSATPPLNIITTKSGGKVIQQVVSSTPPASPTVLQQSIVTPSGTKAQILKIQGGSILQQQAAQAGRRVTALQRAQSVTQGAVTATTPTQQVQKVTLQRAMSIDGSEVRTLEGQVQSAANVIQTAAGKTVNVANLSGGAGTTIVITKPGTPPVTHGAGKTVVATSGTIAQLIQAAPGNHGKPIMIGGKPAYLSGKPIQLIGRQGQIGVIAPGQGHQVLSGVSIVTQAGTSGTTTSSTSQTRVITSGSGTPTIVSQILQGATVQQGKVTGQGHKVQVVQQGGQTRLVTPAGAAGGQGIVVTQLTAPGGKPGQAKLISGSQAGVLAGGQFIVQQGSPSKMIGQQFLTASGTRPTILTTSQGGAPRTGTANIQLVRTVLSQQQQGRVQAAGGQQSTIVLAQPGSATHTVVTDVKNLQTVAGRGKAGGPVYARLIQPPGQIRLATVRTGTPTGGATAVRLAGATNVAGLNVIQAQRVQTPDGVQIITTTAPRGQMTETVNASGTTVVQSPEGNGE